MKKKIGWIGTGVMGGSMAGRLLDAGYDLEIFTRTRNRAESLLQKGAHWNDHPADLARKTDIVCIMVGYPADVREVIFGPHGIIDGWKDPAINRRILIDFTTSSPSLAQEIYEKGKIYGFDALDAPVSGGDIGARNGSLSIMVGGDPDVCAKMNDLWPVLGKNVLLQGPAGSGQHTKMVNQILIAGNMIGVCEALLYATRVGLDPDRVLQSVQSGAAGSWSLTHLAPRILKNDFQPGFYIDHFIKDMEIALAESERMDLKLPGLDLVHQLYLSVQNAGEGKSGTQALIKGLEKINHHRPHLPNEKIQP